MKTLYGMLLFLTLSVLSFNCQKEISYAGGSDNPNANPGSDPVTGTVQGNIIDDAGQPAVGVTIKVGNQVAQTDAHGYFRITDAALDKNTSMVTAEKQNYFKAYRVFRATTGVNQVTIKLIKKELTGSLSSTTGGAVTLSNGAIISLPADGVVKASGGGAYTGSIKVFASYIDPAATDIGSLVPGSFQARDKNNKRVNLASYGMLAVELESASGEKLQIASNSKATLTTPIPSSLQSSAPATISLWYVDEQTGIWKEEGTAVKNGDKYVGEVKHFSYWNCDISVPSVPLSATIKTPDGNPLVYEFVRVRAATGYYGNSYGYTDSLGQINALVPANMELVLEVLNVCGEVIFTRNIGPYTSSSSLGVITVPPTTPSITVIEGVLVDCNNAPVSNGYVIIYYNNTVRYAKANAEGQFMSVFTNCSATPTSFEVLGVDESAGVQGTRKNVPISAQFTNTGNIFACGISTAQYLNYTLDGVSYDISSINGDSSLVGTSVLAVTTPGSPFYNSINGTSLQGERISFGFYSPSRVNGTYPLEFLTVREHNATELVAPFNIVITNFAQNFGEFYEGTFSGEFRDAGLAPIHTINCSFRVKNW